MNKFDQYYYFLINEGWKSTIATGALSLGLALAPQDSLAQSKHSPNNIGNTSQKISRGIRNNNPGNIRDDGIKWDGRIKGSDKEFVTFTSEEYGIRALAIVLANYSKKHNLNTLHSIAHRWAPEIENDTASYIRSLTQKTGYSPHEQLNLLSNRDQLVKVVNAIIAHENANYKYHENIINRGIDMALRRKDLFE